MVPSTRDARNASNRGPVQTGWNAASSSDKPSWHPSSVSDREKKERWFAEATAITDALIKDAGGRYLCPLCLEWFGSVEDVSLEHAPPESVGGREVALTCRACNNTAGHTIDAELRKVETLREFGQRRMTDPMPVKATYVVDGVTIEQKGVALFDDKGLSLGGIPKQNHPDVAPALTRAFDGAVATDSTDWKFTLTFSTPDMRAASIAWLRSGYLAAFSALGVPLHPPRRARARPRADQQPERDRPRALLPDNQHRPRRARDHVRQHAGRVRRHRRVHE